MRSSNKRWSFVAFELELNDGRPGIKFCLGAILSFKGRVGLEQYIQYWISCTLGAFASDCIFNYIRHLWPACPSEVRSI